MENSANRDVTTEPQNKDTQKEQRASQKVDSSNRSC
jgi:hypothetical protein